MGLFFLWCCLAGSCPSRIHPNSPWTEGFTEVSQLDKSSLEISTFQQNWRVASVESHRTRALLEFCCQVKLILVTLLDANAMVRKIFGEHQKNHNDELIFIRFLTYFKSISWPWSVGLGVISTHSDGSFKIPSRPKQHYLKRTDSTIHSSCCCDRNQPGLSVYLLSQLKGWGSLDQSPKLVSQPTG